MPAWRPLDHERVKQALTGRCFICGLVTGNPDFRHTILYQDAASVAFLSKYPTVPGYTLVAPVSHRENVTVDFSEEEYVQVQRTVHRLGGALQRALAAERLYILSLGSRLANAHVHWHLVPVPAGLTLDQQQYALLDRDEYLEFSQDEIAALTRQIQRELDVTA